MFGISNHDDSGDVIVMCAFWNWIGSLFSVYSDRNILHAFNAAFNLHRTINNIFI